MTYSLGNRTACATSCAPTELIWFEDCGASHPGDFAEFTLSAAERARNDILSAQPAAILYVIARRPKADAAIFCQIRIERR